MGNTSIVDIEQTKNDNSSFKEIHLILSRSCSTYIRPDLTKLVMIGNAGSRIIHKPFYSIYDLETGLQIEKKVGVDGPVPIKGAYCFGYFDKGNKTLIFCIGVWAKHIYYIDTDTGEYTEELVNPERAISNKDIRLVTERICQSMLKIWMDIHLQ